MPSNAAFHYGQPIPHYGGGFYTGDPTNFGVPVSGAASFAGGGGGSYGGGGPFGTKVAPTPMPNPFGDLSHVYPNLGDTNAAVSGAIGNRIAGHLSPETVRALHDQAATFGVTSGMPGWNAGNLTEANYLGNIAGAREKLIGEGLAEYNQTLPTVSRTQTVDPGLQAEITSMNALNAAAPDPAAAASYAEGLFNKYLAALQGPAGGTRAPIFADDPHAGKTHISQYNQLWGLGGLSDPLGAPQKVYDTWI